MKILDLSSGNRAVWFNKNHPLAVYLDKRPEVNPTIVCDTTAIPEIVGHDYDLVVFDPPHENPGQVSNMARRYGKITRAQILKLIEGSGREAHRITKKNALMAFKWNDCAYHLDKVLALMAEFWEPLFGHHMRNRGGSAAKSQTYWVLLKRVDINAADKGR